jgi:hypothetical protein
MGGRFPVELDVGTRIRLMVDVEEVGWDIAQRHAVRQVGSVAGRATDGEDGVLAGSWTLHGNSWWLQHRDMNRWPAYCT